jgi:hypothetical protein
MTDPTTSSTAQTEGLAAGKTLEGRLEQCPYDEAQSPVLRAIWQNAFVTARLYGDE